jgi:hypothetical protein
VRKHPVWLVIAIIIFLFACWQLNIYLHLKVKTPSQAKRVAKACAMRIGWSETEPLKASIGTYDRHPGLAWRVLFSDKNRIYIDAVSGDIYNIVCRTEEERVQKQLERKYELKSTLTEDQVREITDELLDRIGRPADCRYLMAFKPRQPSESCGVFWKRTYHNIDFRFDGMVFFLSADSGKLVEYQKDYPTALPKSTKIIIHEKTAVATAIAHARAIETNKIPPELLVQRSVYISIVGRDYIGYTNIRYRGTPRVAWVVTFGKPVAFYEAWIDAETGELLGYENSYDSFEITGK